jgi:uncharacterized protein (DUF362 family)
MSPRLNRVVTVSRPGLAYVERPPFDPPNPVYEAVEAMLRNLGLDAARAGTPEWNPLGDLVRPGDRVVVKPNLVSSRSLHKRLVEDDLRASSSHGSLLRPVLDYLLKAAGPRGQVRVVDAPIEGCEIDQVAGPLGIFAVIEHLRNQGHDVAFVDLRHFRLAPVFALDDARRFGRSYNLGLLVRRRLAGDPRGYRVVDLGRNSFFALPGAPAPSSLRFHRSHYRTPNPHHTAARHEYSIPRSVLDADIVVHLPKLKTHKKTGTTLTLKSAIGLSNEKYWLPHFAAGDPSRGGDEFDRRQSWRETMTHRLARLPLPGGHSLVARAPPARTDAPPPVIDGAWEGNDTLWRTILDLNRILLFADKNGIVLNEPQRRCFALVDGIVAGEGEGPLGVTPVSTGLLVGGFDPALVDAVATQAMGFEPSAIPLVRSALGGALLPYGDLVQLERVLDGPAPSHRFRPPRSWPSLAHGCTDATAPSASVSPGVPAPL